MEKAGLQLEIKTHLLRWLANDKEIHEAIAAVVSKIFIKSMMEIEPLDFSRNRTRDIISQVVSRKEDDPASTL